MKDREVALCTRCVTPVHALDYYCGRCGQAVGPYTTYLPYINIPFEADCLATLWHRLWSRDTGLFARCFFFFLIALFAPILFVMLPLILLDKRRQATAQDPPAPRP